MVRIAHEKGETRLASLSDEVDRLTLCAAVLDVAQMRRLFRGEDSANVCRALGIEPQRSETRNCQAIEAYFNGPLG